MEFKGTKGIWMIAKTDELVNALPTTELYTPSTPDRIGEWIGRIRGNTDKERHANALLISKAPEMLEMLKCYLADLNNIMPASDAQRSRIYDVEQLIKSATEITNH
jgi:hypothetical protein